VDTRRPVRPATRPATRRPAHQQSAPRRRAVTSLWRGASSARKSATIIVFALVFSIAGSMFVANRQIEIHQMQSQLLQDQSTYAVQVGTLTNLSVTQVPSTSLDAILPLPKFSGYAPVTSRTIR
jgi:hypothetical protein